jgi:DNA-binding NtrC family response regulator/pSer/pThr/pTyr-binding forkhead associated (FHA) protein
MAELVFLRRGEEVLRLALGADRVVLGRGERCDVVIPDPEVSRQQVALWLEDGRCEFRDVSGKGTVVAGARLTEGTVADGVDLALGQWRAVYRAHGRGDDEVMVTEIGMTTEMTQKPEAVEANRIAAQLRIRYGSTEEVHKLKGDTVSIGKDRGNDIALDARFVSGRHLKLNRVQNRFMVLDQQSTNGTWLGSARVYEAEVPFFSALKVGEAELVLEPQTTTGKGATSYYGIIGSDPSVKQLAELIDRVAPSSAAIAVFGESGTGKELVARALHARSSRADQAFVPVNCAAISKELIESELFGHEKGAFTGAMVARKGAFEEADGGTLFLDEIGELPLELQAKLLRALESGEIKRVGASKPITVDVRLVTATNRDLLQASKAGKFREDLYYRLCVVPVMLVPLRRRKGDLLALAEHFLKAFAPRGQTVRLSDGAIKALTAHLWPGNIRELRNVIHRALLLRRGPHIEESDLSFDGRGGAPREDDPTPIIELTEGLTLDQHLEMAEKRLIMSALKRYDNNRERVVKELGVARSTLFKRLKDWGLKDAES